MLALVPVCVCCLLVLLSVSLVVLAGLVRCLPRPLPCLLLFSGCFFPCGRRPENRQRNFRYPLAAGSPSCSVLPGLWRRFSIHCYLALIDVEASRITCCGGSRVGFTFVHVVQATLQFLAGWVPFRRMCPTVAVVKDFIEGNTFLPISGWMGTNSSNESGGCRGEEFHRREHVFHFWLDGCQLVE